ncbi:crotonyl-CoA reductase [Methylobacterium sp. 4-46]|nr:crotonyl-CoA reductase [Methylobacterium sp. 4-46]
MKNNIYPLAGSAAAGSTPSVLDLLRQNSILDADIDAAIDAYVANPATRSYVLQSSYCIDFDEVVAAMRSAARSVPLVAGQVDRQALMCALLLHRPRLIRASASVAPKDLYEIGEIPPLGHVPSRMYAWAIRRERHGPPEDSMQVEVVPTWTIGDDEVLVLVMAAGVNYNGVWAGLGEPISPFDVHKAPFHVAGSDASGIVWAVGAKVKRWKVGDEVIVHCNQDDGDDEECNGGDPMVSPSQRIWGYETPDGSFGQFCRVQSRQLMRRPQHLTWEESACYTLTLATAYRMLFGHAPHTVRPGQNVLIWGASGGLGVFGVQLAHLKQAAAANQFVIDRRVDPCMSELFPWDKIPHAHTKMWRNQHAPGNMAVLVNAQKAGLRTFDDVLELSGSR